MPLMKLQKNRVFASTLGHTIRFVKDEPVFVPPIMERECDAIGAILVDADHNEIDTTATEDDLANSLSASINAARQQEGIDPEEATPSQPAAPLDRMKLILKAVHLIMDKNDREDFTAAGQVNLKVLGKTVGFRVDKNELKEAMAIINDPE
jgi:hypothetical protein